MLTQDKQRVTGPWDQRELKVKTARLILVGAVVLAALGGTTGCVDFLVNQTTSLGGTTAGDRGQVQVVIINNTPHLAVMTVGTYDQVDRFSEPDFGQFSFKDDPATGEIRLAGNGNSGIFAQSCGRVFSVGGPDLLEMIEVNLPDVTLQDEAFVEGVDFYSVDEEGEPDVLIGSAPPLEALLGVDFPCGALLILHLEIDDFGPEPFRIDFELIPSESTR